ncbi:GntR family transcriptional regulator [Phenylobacterium montanum]|uniref:GntR family transcriptional regulator n=1 Tax=Phenylobacterium montanum TaxID=2823693 RepID=A0A975G3C7_9CAUL|nr:GntR family transcriptional regulator [Caulobacter sp. S6]QUD90130.1 GntR family transcriptional regulator [Caulobacter sp. S6]
MSAINSTGERIYRAIKRQVVAGEFRPAEKIDARILADQHGASLTPVRTALHRLVGEGLVEAHPNEGFHAPAVSEPLLHDLYVWNEQVLQAARRLGGDTDPQRLIPLPSDAAPDPAAFSARLFRAVALGSGNAICLSAVETLNDRLSAARAAEARLYDDLISEIQDLALVLSRSPDQAGRAIVGYHRRRLRDAPQIVRLIHRL